VVSQNRPTPTGWAVFAGTLLCLIGSFQGILGLIALFNPNAITATGQGLVLWSFWTWGWIHLIAGAVLVLVSVGLFAAQNWARWAAILVAALSAIAAIGFFTAYPLWSFLLIVLDVVMIYQLAVHYRVRFGGIIEVAERDERTDWNPQQHPRGYHGRFIDREPGDAKS
jgi:hypothetical protein